MKLSLYPLALIVFLFSNISSARDWTEVGNGGDALVCGNPSFYRMYDSYEAQYRHGLKPVFPFYEEPSSGNHNGDNNKNHLSISIGLAQDIIFRLKSKDPERYQRYMQWISEFAGDAQFLDHTYLTDVPDIGVGALPIGCTLEQLIIQRTPLFPKSKRYSIAHDFWRQLPFKDQAVAIIHEILYREAMIWYPRIQSSERIRYFNALIISDEVSKMSVEEYFATMELVFYSPH